MQQPVTRLLEGFLRLTDRQKAAAYLAIEDIRAHWPPRAPARRPEPRRANKQRHQPAFSGSV